MRCRYFCINEKRIGFRKNAAVFPQKNRRVSAETCGRSPAPYALNNKYLYYENKKTASHPVALSLHRDTLSVGAVERQRRRNVHQPRTLGGRARPGRNPRGRHVLYGQHHHAPDARRSRHALERFGELGNGELRVRQADRQTELRLERRYGIRTRAVGHLAQIPQREVLRLFLP